MKFQRRASGLYVPDRRVCYMRQRMSLGAGSNSLAPGGAGGAGGGDTVVFGPEDYDDIADWTEVDPSEIGSVSGGAYQCNSAANYAAIYCDAATLHDSDTSYVEWIANSASSGSGRAMSCMVLFNTKTSRKPRYYSVAADKGYEIDCWNNKCAIVRINGATRTALTDVAMTWAADDVFRVEVTPGATPTIVVKKNDVEVTSHTDSSPPSGTGSIFGHSISGLGFVGVKATEMGTTG